MRATDPIRPSPGPRARGAESGRGMIGFLVALVLVIYGGMALKSYYQIKSKHDQLDDFVEATIRDADTRHMNEDQVRFEIFKRAKELDIPLSDDKAVEVRSNSAGWMARVEWDDVFRIPGYSSVVHYSVEKEWKK